MKLLYFAWLKDRLGRAEEEVALPEDVRTVADLLAWLKGRGPDFAAVLADDTVIRVAVDQEYATAERSLAGAQEIALFPPVTGG